MKKLLTLTVALIIIPLSVRAGVSDFFVELEYDHESRESLQAKEIVTTEKLDFYVDSVWWNRLNEEEQETYKNTMEELGEDFAEETYEKITSVFGDPPARVAEEDEITVLIHPMRESAGGYFNSGDQYSRHQNPRSNEKNLLYLNNEVLSYEDGEGFLAHEFMHLLTYNQKEEKRGVREEVWLNESRAEYMPTFLNYDEKIANGNLANRADTFFRRPDVSLTEWVGERGDYGVVRIFTQYLVDRYGREVLVDSLKSDKVGIESINYALDQQGVEKEFSEVFDNFKIAAVKNDCELGEEHCFKHVELKDRKVRPAQNYLPATQDGELKVSYQTTHWTGNWHEITGGRGDLSFTLSLEEDLEVSMPYILCDKEECKVERERSDSGKINLEVESFDDNWESLIVMPSLQEKKEGFNGPEDKFTLQWTAQLSREDEALRRLEKLRELKERLEELQERLEEEAEERARTCVIEGPLYYGMTDSDSVACLQKFLTLQPDIYPESLVTGNFSDRTRQAVIRFQERYAEEILYPLGLEEGTGYVGRRTISKIDNLR